MEKFYYNFTNPAADFSLAIEDNGRVAYGYLILNKRIIGDVWLYNRAPAPEAPEWKIKNNAPFLNADAYVEQPLDFVPLNSREEVNVEWLMEGSAVSGVAVIIRGNRHAEILRGEKPGRCRFARKDGPLARRLK